MKVYVVMNALPWEQFSVAVSDPQNEGQTLRVHGVSDDTRAGFLPIFWTQEAAELAYPGFLVHEAEVPDTWHPRAKA